MLWPSQPGPRGVSRSSRHAGGDVVDAGGVGARAVCRAGHSVSEHYAHTTGAACVRQNRVVLAPGVCAPRLAVMCPARPGGASAIRKATGAIVHRSPGRARHKSSNHCAGKAGCLASPVCRCAASRSAIFAQWTVGASRHPAFPAPSALLRAATEAKLGQNAPRECETARTMRVAVRGKFGLSCPGRSAAPLRRCAAEPGPMQQQNVRRLGPGAAPQRSRVAAGPGHACGCRVRPTPPASPPRTRAGRHRTRA
ncbi:hypothetical protein AB7M17_006403 [Bradyrhizobium sp. USDA 377]